VLFLFKEEKMIKILVVVLAVLFSWNMAALAQEKDYEAACTKECNFLTKDCTAYIDCRVAKATCLESCMQRKVWEKVAVSLDKLSAVIEKQGKEKEDKEENLQPYISTRQLPAEEENTTAESQTVSDSAQSMTGNETDLY
jgi:hypothetical protein